MRHELISIPSEAVEGSILLIRSQKVILDRTLAKLYGVSTKMLNQAVKRNLTRFPPDFMFQLTVAEAKAADSAEREKPGGKAKPRPYAFTEHGILTLSSVLNSERADQVSIEIMRTFVRLRETPDPNAELTKRVDALEHDYKFVFDAIRKPMRRAVPRRKPIGFRANSVKR